MRAAVQVGVWRCVWLAAAVLLGLYRHTADRAVAHAFSYLREQWWFKHDSFEPLVAVLSFFPPIVLYYVLDLFVPAARRWRLHASNAMDQWTKKDGFSGWPILVSYLTPLLIFDTLFPRRKLPEAAPSALQLVAEIAAGLVVYDALFFLVHRSCHGSAFLFRHVHRLHHEYKVTRAFDTLRLTYTEQLLDVSCAIAALNLLGAHPLSRACFNVVIVYLLCELHCGYDMPWMAHNVVPGGLVSGPPGHDIHHRQGRGNYAKFFTWWDRLAGSFTSASTCSPAMADLASHTDLAARMEQHKANSET